MTVKFNQFVSSSTGSLGTTPPTTTTVQNGTSTKTGLYNNLRETFNKMRQAGSNGQNYDIKPGDLMSQAEEMHKTLLESGAKVVSHNKKTGETKYSNGMTLVLMNYKDKAGYSVQVDDNGKPIKGGKKEFVPGSDIQTTILALTDENGHSIELGTKEGSFGDGNYVREFGNGYFSEVTTTQNANGQISYSNLEEQRLGDGSYLEHNEFKAFN